MREGRAMSRRDDTWRIGELARETGLTVRTLHHYDRLGLLSPLSRTEGGHRCYTGGDVRRLHRISGLVSRYFSAIDDQRLDRATVEAVFTAEGRLTRPNGAS